MTEVVAADRIEQKVGARRHLSKHYGRAVSSEQTAYILHSQACKGARPDLRTCPFSVALDRGIDLDRDMPDGWGNAQDMPVQLAVWNGHLVPVKRVWLSEAKS